ncbi:hypothetical protein [Persicirhabdus sediminis]|uniref:Uncharacterized protein n=1 Tax=Persicirhabdus sediminis TaxID=454144 RepID=A0A8J7SLM1_9BACT|nr:hypothetical protein [Persicirhabdus sediminis]MBK1790488.1 hypothetical protein [Persicirhabdus sediminis]
MKITGFKSAAGLIAFVICSQAFEVSAIRLGQQNDAAAASENYQKGDARGRSNS